MNKLSGILVKLDCTSQLSANIYGTLINWVYNQFRYLFLISVKAPFEMFIIFCHVNTLLHLTFLGENLHASIRYIKKYSKYIYITKKRKFVSHYSRYASKIS